MENSQLHQIKSISEFHKLRGLPKPEHPLISVVDYATIQHTYENNQISWVQNFYTIGLKRDVCGKFRYGQQEYDFDEGLMSFIAPRQVFSIDILEEEEMPNPTGWLLLIHPDFLWNSPLANSIKGYDFFGYEVHEALFLSEKEEIAILEIMQNIKQEYHSNIDKFSQGIMISQIELLLNYAQRFYNRQFITRQITNHQVLDILEVWLDNYFKSDQVVLDGLPSVQRISDELHMSSNYLSSLLKSLTGQSTKQHIHQKLLDIAKEKLSTTMLSVSEIAYDLGFEHPQSFSKLFKSKTQMTPLEFRRSFN
ncbi:helix-turn-helix domain-containing protein [Galbibacter sp.]|jgi:AraC-like DNA-binding protein|uniref:helix-turn-helix domain-containing protein n=1 Tax=Galbibacter sp. TaxID=2918471 RepID=UPI003A8D3FD1